MKLGYNTPHITAFEHSLLQVTPKGSGDSITQPEADRLQHISELRKGFCERKFRAVKLANYAGIVDLGSRTLEVLPKVDPHAPASSCRGMVLRLLMAAGDFPVFRDRPVGHSLRRQSLLEVFISLFLDSVARLARGGLLRRYRQEEDDLQVVRGRILGERQFTRNFNRPDRISCRFDDLTPDNYWNRLVKSGLRAVGPWISTVAVSQRWFETLLLFDEVADLPLPVLISRMPPMDRQASRYADAVFWVRLIARTLSPGIRAGDEAASGLLFDMNALFERAIGRRLARTATAQGEVGVSLQAADRHLARVVGSGQKVAQLRPDIVVRRGQRATVIMDTKWKRVRLNTSNYLIPDEADMYQMIAYAAAYECGDVRLVYPWYADLEGARETVLDLPRVAGVATRLSVVCVDLNADEFPARRGSLSIIWSGSGSSHYPERIIRA